MSPSRKSKELASAAKFLKVSPKLLKALASQWTQMDPVRIMDLVNHHISAEKAAARTRDAEPKVQSERPGSPDVPLLLSYRGYLRFRHNAESMIADAEDLKAALELINLCSAGWEDDSREMTPIFNDFFSDYLDVDVERLGIEDFLTDGVIEGTFILFEHKPMTSETFSHLRRMFEKSRRRRRCASCGLIVQVARGYIQFVAAAMDWKLGKLVTEPLTPMLNCFGSLEHEHLVLASALRAFRLFCNEYERLAQVEPSVPFVFAGKQVVRLRKSLAFVELGQGVVKKLTRRYSAEAHRLWAEQGVAPALRGVSELGAGWLLVEMDLLGDDWADAHDVVARISEQQDRVNILSECIRAAADKGHTTGFVHGDMRLPNIKIRPTDDERFQVMFVDFDWSGRAGVATYPVLLNSDINWHPDAGYGKAIAKEHDLHFVHNLLAQDK